MGRAAVGRVSLRRPVSLSRVGVRRGRAVRCGDLSERSARSPGLWSCRSVIVARLCIARVRNELRTGAAARPREPRATQARASPAMSPAPTRERGARACAAARPIGLLSSAHHRTDARPHARDPLDVGATAILSPPDRPGDCGWRRHRRVTARCARTGARCAARSCAAGARGSAQAPGACRGPPAIRMAVSIAGLVPWICPFISAQWSCEADAKLPLSLRVSCASHCAVKRRRPRWTPS